MMTSEAVFYTNSNLLTKRCFVWLDVSSECTHVTVFGPSTNIFEENVDVPENFVLFLTLAFPLHCVFKTRLCVLANSLDIVMRSAVADARNCHGCVATVFSHNFI